MRLPPRSLPAVGRIGRRFARALNAALPRRRPGSPIRSLTAIAVLLVASLGMGANSPSSELTANRISTLTPLGPVAGVSEVSLLIDAAQATGRARRNGPEYYRRTTRKRVAPGTAAEFLPLYREAERVFGVNWRLLASVHRQETAFSQADTTYHGLNDFGCCAGPMQFNVTNGPVSTWERYRNAFRAGRRPQRYPHRTKHHPSIYDDFDAIMAAGSLLRAGGAAAGLGGGEWAAAYAYYGHDLYGVTYASQVVARAAGWQRYGFCANCEPDALLVDELDSAYGAAIREELLAAERKNKKKKRKKKRTGTERAVTREADAARAQARRDDARRRAAARKAPAPAPAPDAAADPAAPPTETTTTAAPAAPPPAAPASQCTGVRKLLGC